VTLYRCQVICWTQCTGDASEATLVGCVWYRHGMPRSVIAACVFWSRIKYMGIPLSKFILCSMFRIMFILQQRQVSVKLWSFPLEILWLPFDRSLLYRLVDVFWCCPAGCCGTSIWSSRGSLQCCSTAANLFLSKSLVDKPFPNFPKGPLWKEMPVSRAFSTYPSGSPAREPSLHVPLTELP